MDDLLYKLLQKIRDRPGLYLGEKSLIYLYYLILGYEDRAFETDPNYHDCLDGFDEFVYSYYYDQPIGTRSWKRFILDNTNTQEEAFDEFYELLDEFIKQNESNQENA